MARLLLLTLFCVTICLAAKSDHSKKGPSSPLVKTPPSSDDLVKGNNYDEPLPSDGDGNELAPPNMPNEKTTGSPLDDSTPNTELGSDMGPNAGPVKDDWSPKPIPSQLKVKGGPKPVADSEDEGLNEQSKLPKINKKISQAKPIQAGGNFASAVHILQTAQPGIDYPAYSMDNMPSTSFRCDQQNYPGYYADPEAQCQVFHYCPFKVEGMITVGIPFLCPNFTIFDQKTLSCNWFYQVDCNQAPSLYDKINSRLYQTVLPLIDDEPSEYGPPPPSPSKPKPTSIRKKSKGKVVSQQE